MAIDLTRLLSVSYGLGVVPGKSPGEFPWESPIQSALLSIMEQLCVCVWVCLCVWVWVCTICVWVWVVCHVTGSTGSLDHSSTQTSKTVELDG